MLNNQELYRHLCGIENTTDYRVYFYRAAYEYLHKKDCCTLDKIQKDVSKAIQLYEDNTGVTEDTKLCYTILKELLNIDCHTSANYYPMKMYLLSAEILGEMDRAKDSSGMYRKYYYYCNKVQPAKELRDKDSVIVYSFRRYNEYSLQDIINGEITCVHPDKMNDPFDSIANYISKPDRLDKVCHHTQHVKAQSECFKHFTIRSFVANRETYDNDDRILQGKTMWSHYADNHRGLCLKYKLSKDFFHQFDDANNTFTRLIPIEYVDKKISSREALNSDNSFAMKDICWEAEKEVRLLHLSVEQKDHQSISLDTKSSLEEIIFGYCCDENSKKTIEKIAPNGCKLSQMENDDEDIYTLKKYNYSKE